MEMICIQLINSNSPWYEAHGYFKDALQEKDWVKWFLGKWCFPTDLTERADAFEPLSGLRSLLTEALDFVLAGKELPQDVLKKMNQYLAGSSLHYEVKAKDRQYALTLFPDKADLQYVLSEITASFVRMMNESEAARLKRCENQNCLSVFYDSSKNQARKWCCNTCSSLIKVRRHREKKKNNPDDSV